MFILGFIYKISLIHTGEEIEIQSPQYAFIYIQEDKNIECFTEKPSAMVF